MSDEQPVRSYAVLTASVGNREGHTYEQGAIVTTADEPAWDFAALTEAGTVEEIPADAPATEPAPPAVVVDETPAAPAEPA